MEARHVPQPRRGGGEQQAWISSPAEPGRYPAIIMFHGRNGVNDAFKDVGVRYAEEGIVGIGPTVTAALRAFDAQYLAGLRPPAEMIRECGAVRSVSSSVA